MPAHLDIDESDDLYGLSAGDLARVGVVVNAYEGGYSVRKGQRRPPDRNFAKVLFRNDNGSTAPAFGVLRVTGTTIIDQFTYLTVDQPDSTYHWFYLINGSEDVATNGHGWGTWLWHGGRALYDNANTPAFGEQWGPQASSWKLGKQRPGFWVMGGNDTTLTLTTCVQIVPQELLVKNDTGSDKAAGTSTTFNLYAGTAGSEASLSLSVPSCYNRTSVSFNNGKFGMIAYNCGNVYVSPQET